MMRLTTRKLLAVAIFISITVNSYSQPNRPGPFESDAAAKTDAKPFKVLTNGKQITVRGIKTIQSIMVWTASGHRILEQKQVNALSYTFGITINEKVFFVMVQLQDGKLYTEKIAIR